MAKRGRPRLYHTDAQREQARLNAKQKVKNVTLDADLLAALNTVADKLEAEMGFRPTLSQAVRHLINHKAKS